MTNCRACNNLDLFQFKIREEVFQVCGECFCVMSETSSAREELPRPELGTGIINGFDSTHKITLENATSIMVVNQELIYDKTQMLSYSPLVDIWLTKVVNKMSKNTLWAIELFPTNCYATYFKNVSARPYNYFSTKSIKKLVERNGLHLISSLYLSSPSHQLFFISRNPDVYSNLQNIDALLKVETTMNYYNLNSYRDMEKYYKIDE